MNIHLLAADIARRVPDMNLDSRQNNSELIEQLIGDAVFLNGFHERYRYESSQLYLDGTITIKYKPFKPFKHPEVVLFEEALSNGDFPPDTKALSAFGFSQPPTSES